MQLFILKLNEDESFSQFTTTAMLVRASDAVEARSIATRCLTCTNVAFSKLIQAKHAK